LAAALAVAPRLLARLRGALVIADAAADRMLDGFFRTGGLFHLCSMTRPPEPFNLIRRPALRLLMHHLLTI